MLNDFAFAPLDLAESQIIASRPLPVFAVSNGAALLDQRKVPNWAKRIDLYRLNIANPYDCILGQLYGFYSTGLFELRVRNSWEYGFNGSSQPALTLAWRQLITSRREMALVG